MSKNIYESIVGNSANNEQAYFGALLKSINKDGKQLVLGGLLERSALIFPDTVALICNDISMTYKELYFRSCLMAEKIKAVGIKPRDRVLLFFENSLEFYIGYFGIVQAGAVIAPLNIFLHENELQHIIKDAQPACVVTAAQHVDLFRKNGLQVPLLTEADMDLTSPVPTNSLNFKREALEYEDMAALLYTSGTTGLPKGVMLSSKNIITNSMQALSRLPLRESERLFGVLPLFHSFSQNACVWTAIFAGCTVIVVPKIERRYILAALKHKPTIMLGVPAFYGLLCLLKNAPFPNVKYFVSGGDALPDKIRALFALIYGRKLVNGYGLTETSPMISADMDDETAPTSNVGLPVVGLDIAIVDEHDNKVSHGSIGQLIVKGDNVMMGYYNAPQATADTIKNGWFYTGDLAYIDDKGKIVITGRIKDLIIHKGFNIYPQEIENIIISHPNVMRVGVVGRPHEESGEVPVAFVQLRAAQEGVEKELKALCLKHLAAYKVPKEFFVTMENLPTTATGKVDKKVLRKKL